MSKIETRMNRYVANSAFLRTLFLLLGFAREKTSLNDLPTLPPNEPLQPLPADSQLSLADIDLADTVPPPDVSKLIVIDPKPNIDSIMVDHYLRKLFLSN